MGVRVWELRQTLVPVFPTYLNTQVGFRASGSFSPKTPLDQGFGFVTRSDGADFFVHIKVGIAALKEE